MAMRRRLGNMINRLAVAVTIAVVAACLLGGILFSRHHYGELIGGAQATARTQAELIRVALEHQMIENERALIAEMVTTFARDRDIAGVRILDREGRIQFSSQPGETGVRWPPETSATCKVCHDRPGAARESSATFETEGGTIMRSVVPILNRPACHGCHDPADRINGVLLVDVRAGAIRAAVERDTRWLVLVTGAIAVGLLVSITISVRLIILRRLERFEAAARAIAGGELERRLPVSGTDILSWMARAFNKMVDSTARLASELDAQRQQLETVINSVDDGIVVLDPRRQVIAANDAFLARACKDREGVVGRRCTDALGPLCPAGTCPARACFDSGRREDAVLTCSIGDDARFEEVRASPIRSEGRVVAVVEVWRDITSRRLAEARMAEQHRMASLGLLASGFSHEMNTPLGTTLVAVEGLLRNLDSGAELGEEERRALADNARIAREQVLRCRGVTQQFLRLSRGQSAATDLVAVRPVIEAVTRLAQTVARDRGVEVSAPPGADATVRASEPELQQVLLNLVLNAVQACEAGGRVEVGLEAAAGDAVRLRVRDTGCGIPAEQLRRVFEPFYSLRPGGTGLGLFLSLDMARGWGADLVASSVAGEGSTFEVVFPRPVTAAVEV